MHVQTCRVPEHSTRPFFTQATSRKSQFAFLLILFFDEAFLYSVFCEERLCSLHSVSGSAHPGMYNSANLH